MASGKSLELAQIKPHASPKCTCGAAWTEHLRKDQKGLLKKFADGTHSPMTLPARPGRRALRQMMRKAGNSDV